ncbi:hypothetical protein DFS34DRAFT_635441, partial [Phlyctochytrium arcticum]
MLRTGILRAARAGKSWTLIEPRRVAVATLGQCERRLYSQQQANKKSSLDLAALLEAETHEPEVIVEKPEKSEQVSAKSDKRDISKPSRESGARTTSSQKNHNEKVEALFQQNNNAISATRDAFLQGEEAGNHADWTIDEYTYIAHRFDKIPTDLLRGTSVFLAIWQAVVSRDWGVNAQLLEMVVRNHVIRERKQRIDYFRLKQRIDEERARIVESKAVDSDLEKGLETLEFRIAKLEDKTILQGLESVVADAVNKKWTLSPAILHMVLQTYIINRTPEKVEEWVSRMTTQSVRPHVPEYCDIIRMYGRIGDVYNAQRYLEAYLQAPTAQRRVTDSEGHDKESVFAAFIQALGDSKKAAIGLDVVERLMPQHNVVPGIRSYNALLRAYFAEGDVEAAKALFQRMTKEKALPTPNGSTFNVAFAGAAQAKDLDLAAEMLTRASNDPDTRPNFLTIFSYGRLWLDAGKVEQALAAYKTCTGSLPVTDTLFTVPLLKALFKTQPDEAFNILESRIANPADRTVGSLIKAMTEVSNNVPSLLRLQKLAMVSSHKGPG